MIGWAVSYRNFFPIFLPVIVIYLITYFCVILKLYHVLILCLQTACGSFFYNKVLFLLQYVQAPIMVFCMYDCFLSQKITRFSLACYLGAFLNYHCMEQTLRVYVTVCI